jgi:hypothetical protein
MIPLQGCEQDIYLVAALQMHNVPYSSTESINKCKASSIVSLAWPSSCHSRYYPVADRWPRGHQQIVRRPPPTDFVPAAHTLSFSVEWFAVAPVARVFRRLAQNRVVVHCLPNCTTPYACTRTLHLPELLCKTAGGAHIRIGAYWSAVPFVSTMLCVDNRLRRRSSGRLHHRIHVGAVGGYVHF